ncbi:MAG: sulfotransferase [Actinomycetota bacterium]
MTDSTRGDTAPDIIYVLGAGRSGSTVLGIVLGNLPNVFYGGELFAWPHFRGVPITENDEVAAFWADFAATMPDDPIHATDDYYYGLERWSAVFRPRFYVDRQLRRDQRAHVTELFAQLKAHSGAATIVDSSHFPLRLGALRRAGLSVAAVHLTRDSRDVIRALGRREQRRAPLGPLPAVVYCWVTELMSRWQMRRAGSMPVLRVRYEDLVAEPERWVRTICDTLGVPAADIDPQQLVPGPVFNGNRLRHAETIALRAPGPRAEASGVMRLADLLVRPLRR